MKVRVKRNIGFRPVSVKINFDNAVEYACFKGMMGTYAGTPQSLSIPHRVAEGLTGIISSMSGVILSKNEVEQCLKGVMRRIFRKLPNAWKGD